MIRALHRLAYRLAHAARHRWRRWRQVPLEGVTMIACDRNARVLMVRLSYADEGWSLPGGGAGRGEAMAAAAARELREETGCGAIRVKAIGSFEETVSGSPHTAHVFTCLTDDQPRPDGREVIEARFFPTHSLPHPMTPRTHARLALWREVQNGVTAG